MIKKLSFIPVFVLCFFAATASAQNVPESNPAAQNNLDQRITERLERLKTNLKDEQLEQIKENCKQAQVKIAAVKKQAESYYEDQSQSVQSIIENADSISQNLDRQSSSVESLNSVIGDIKNLNQKIKKAYDNYLLALGDSIEIDCSNSPEGFRLSVDDAKKQSSDLNSLRTQMIGKIKSDLKSGLEDLKGNIE